MSECRKPCARGRRGALWWPRLVLDDALPLALILLEADAVDGGRGGGERQLE